jgi:transcriptional regulator NrdR family protein
MNCPKCSYPDMRVIRSNYDANDTVDRRRQCDRCGLRVNTQEMLKEKPKDKIKHVLVT